MRTITLIVLHCDGIMPHEHNTIKKINEYHKSKGWKGAGYHFFVQRDGTVEEGRKLWEVGAHCVNHNKYSIGICYEGGLDSAGDYADTRTPEQKRVLRELVERMHSLFPRAVIVGHRDLNPGKKCPCYNAAEEYKDLQP